MLESEQDTTSECNGTIFPAMYEPWLKLFVQHKPNPILQCVKGDIARWQEMERNDLINISEVSLGSCFSHKLLMCRALTWGDNCKGERCKNECPFYSEHFESDMCNLIQYYDVQHTSVKKRVIRIVIEKLLEYEKKLHHATNGER